MNTIESLMMEMEEDRRQRRIATLSDTTQADGGVWKVEPSPNACPTCLEFSRKTYAEKPNPPHPNCKCHISKQEKKKRYYVIGRRPLDGLGSVSTTKLDWIKKWDKNTYKSGKGGLPALLPEHRRKISADAVVLSTGTFLILKATILAFSAMITSGLIEKGTFHRILMVM